MQFVTKREPFDISIIKEIEKQFKIKIPEVLKKYYLKYGNSHIKTCEFNVDGLLTDVSEIVSINKNDSSSFYQVMDYGRSDGWIPDYFYPFAHDSGGNYYFWNAKNEHIYLILDDDIDNPFEVCKSMKKFFKILENCNQ